MPARLADPLAIFAARPKTLSAMREAIGERMGCFAISPYRDELIDLSAASTVLFHSQLSKMQATV